MLPFRSILLLLPPLLVHSVVNLTSQEVFEGIQNGRFDAIVDTRTPPEWAAGHLPHATFLNVLHKYNTTDQIATPHDLEGCQGAACTIVVYCHSGVRAGIAAQMLEHNGFATVYNGLGVKQWAEAGYDLVNTSSLVPECKGIQGQLCLRKKYTCGGRGSSCGTDSDCCEGIICRGSTCGRKSRGFVENENEKRKKFGGSGSRVGTGEESMS